MIEVFLISALSVQPLGAQGYQIDTDVRVIQAISEEELAEKIKRHNPDVEEVFIHPSPHEEKMREHGWERVPFNWNGKQVWIKRKEKSDTEKRQSRLTASA